MLCCCFLFSTLFVSFFAQFNGSVAVVSNRTIDDEFGDSVTGKKPVFLPNIPNTWQGPDCITCGVQPDKTKAFNQTFKASTYTPEKGYTSIGLSFKGTAIYVFFIIPNTVYIPIRGTITTLTECNFTLDNEHAGYYRHAPSSSTDIMYNVSVFQSENLPNTDHILNISTSGLDYHTFTNFDYAIYTFDDSSFTPSSNPPPTISTTISTTASNANLRPPNGTMGSRPAVVSPATFPQGSTQSPKTSDSAPPSQTKIPGNERIPLGTIVGGGVGAVTSIILITLLFILYRHRTRTTVSRPGTTVTTAAVAPYVMTIDYNLRHPKTVPAGGESSTAPLIQRQNTAARNAKFPFNGYVNFHRGGHGYASAGSESSGDGIHRAAADGSPTRMGIREALNVDNARSTSHDQPTNIVTTSAEIGQTTTFPSPAPINFPGDVDARRRWRLRRSQRPPGAGLERRLRGLAVRTNRRRSRGSLAEVAQLRERMQSTQDYITYLQSLLRSGELPPEYTTAITERRAEGI